jgi:transcription antitermination factor NusG
MSALYSIGDFVEFVEQPAITAPMPSLWYLLRLHPNYDLKAERQLHERGISAYVPKERRKIKSVWGRRVLRQVPIFPGTMFIPDFDADIIRLKNACDGVGGFIKYGTEALRISLSTMAEVRRFETKMNRDPGKRKFHLDQKVRVIGGPFDLLEGRIDRLDARYRIRVLLNILGEASVELDEDQVEAV